MNGGKLIECNVTLSSVIAPMQRTKSVDARHACLRSRGLLGAQFLVINTLELGGERVSLLLALLVGLLRFFELGVRGGQEEHREHHGAGEEHVQERTGLRIPHDDGCVHVDLISLQSEKATRSGGGARRSGTSTKAFALPRWRRKTRTGKVVRRTNTRVDVAGDHGR